MKTTAPEILAIKRHKKSVAGGRWNRTSGPVSSARIKQPARRSGSTLFILVGIVTALACSSVWAWREAGRNWTGLWLTPNQQGAREFVRGNFDEAAKHFVDSRWQGVALYRSGQFKEAAAAFARTVSPETWFNRGDALVMTGNYPGAISAFTHALELRPGWREAEENRALAAARDKLMHPPNDGSENTGGEEKPDQIVFDKQPEQAEHAEKVQVVTAGNMSDEEVQALWLRRVQTKPADFLAAKFSYQLSVQKTPVSAAPPP